MGEEITKAYHSVQFLCNDLREAYDKSDNLAGSRILNLLTDAINMEKKLGQLNRALEVE